MITTEQWRLIKYLNFKMECARDQETKGIPLDYEHCQNCIWELTEQQKSKNEQLASIMPKVPKYKVKSKPKITHKKDGTLSANGDKWFRLLKANKLPMYFSGDIKVVDGYKEPNPNSATQVKDWLYALGWEPEEFKYERDKETGDERKIPQVRYSTQGHPRKGELTDCVLKLKDKEPGIEVLEGLSIINHRLAVFNSFISNAVKVDGEWRVYATVGGLTNTLRFQHRAPIANLPKVGVPWGKEIRACLLCEKNHTMIGSDMVSLESTTKRHYMEPIDPEYVALMSEPGFDEHLDLAVFAGAITADQAKAHKAKEADYGNVRQNYKQVNYSAIYGIGAPKLARSTGLSEKDAKKLIEAYWERNHAVKQVSQEQYVKTLKNGEMWLLNPVSNFYINLRYEKDIFSSLNQSTGVYCFDTWVWHCKRMGVDIPMQYHDEIMVQTVDVERTTNLLQKAIQQTNDKIKLNVPLAVDVQTGPNYAEVH